MADLAAYYGGLGLDDGGEMMKTTLMLIAAGLPLAATPRAHAANLDAGRRRRRKSARHATAWTALSTANAEYPKIGGQHRDYLAKALRDYKSGARKNAIMGAMAPAADRAGHREHGRVLRVAAGAAQVAVLTLRRGAARAMPRAQRAARRPGR